MKKLCVNYLKLMSVITFLDLCGFTMRKLHQLTSTQAYYCTSTLLYNVQNSVAEIAWLVLGRKFTQRPRWILTKKTRARFWLAYAYTPCPFRDDSSFYVTWGKRGVARYLQQNSRDVFVLDVFVSEEEVCLIWVIRIFSPSFIVVDCGCKN